MTATTLKRRREEIYGVAAGGAEYHAIFSLTGGLYRAALYDRDGVFVENRGSVVDGSAVSYDFKSPAFLVRHDEADLVGDGALAFWSFAPEKLSVFDFESGSAYVETVVSGDAIGCGAGYSGGYLWWIEHTYAFDDNPTTVTFRLRRCRCDLSVIETVTEETIDLNTGPSDPWHQWLGTPFRWFAMTPDAAVAGFVGGVLGKAKGEVAARFPLNGEPGSLVERGRPTNLPRTVGLATAADAPAYCVGFPVTYDGPGNAAFGTLSGYSVANTPATPPLPLWPTGGDWMRAYGDSANVTLHSNGTDAAFYSYGTHSLDDQVLVRNGVDSPYGGSPARRIVPARHPDLEFENEKPLVMFIRG